MKKLLYGVIGAVIALVGFIVIAGIIGIREDNNAFGTLADVCRGNTVKVAAYSPEAGIHPAMGISKDSDDSDYQVNTAVIPEEAKAETLEQTELVACIEAEQETLVESCAYVIGEGEDANASVERYAYSRDVKLIEASTGNIVDQTTLAGNAPRECLDDETFVNDSKLLTVKGDNVSNNDIQEWLREFVVTK
jgi:hypothetical protein